MLDLRLLEQLLHGLAEGGVHRLDVLRSDFATWLLLHCDGSANLRSCGNAGCRGYSSSEDVL